MGQFDGRVALITGAARGQGRAHALRLADEGADIIAIDICADLPTVPYPLATEDDLGVTVKEVLDRGRRIAAFRADTRDYARMEAVVAEAVADLGRIDIVVVNAGVESFTPIWEMTPEQWNEVVDVNLTGAFNTVRTVLPTLMSQGPGSSITLISSAAGLAAFPNLGHYTASKHGVTGLMRSLATELAPHGIRANSVHPTAVDTPMIQNDAMKALLGVADKAGADAALQTLNALPVPYVESVDVTNVVAFLSSDAARYITGATIPVDAGSSLPYRIPHAVGVA
ncbi:mycofactocin-coupled SDR family oxidoreductase [Pseudonocardia broussonetiae]|uniref:Mycofactocin-coupled SDR family oxidoreductase n=1 Tax=Pseudonocardia broussonetiae TaxID=2736640 RepID=A0A6M6JQ99_9PSEU|nr:mycofactocin-coupled SDR family oxidoreductase [Pseudonocardia broussonetiae]QJY49403.1 mycofactocin-coupled SDR family oxidoreductase [Pseudonocardia broussonetiae]